MWYSGGRTSAPQVEPRAIGRGEVHVETKVADQSGLEFQAADRPATYNRGTGFGPPRASQGPVREDRRIQGVRAPDLSEQQVEAAMRRCDEGPTRVHRSRASRDLGSDQSRRIDPVDRRVVRSFPELYSGRDRADRRCSTP